MSAQDQFARFKQNEENIQPEPEIEILNWPDAVDQSIYAAAEFVKLPCTERQALLGSWLREEDMGMIYAARGAGKTMFALGLARAIAAGVCFGPWFGVNSTRVLYVDGEMHQPDFQNRILGLGEIPANLSILSHQVFYEIAGVGPNLSVEDLRNALTEIITKRKIKLVILDNLSTLISGVKENDSFEWEDMQQWLLDLRRLKTGGIVIHHAGRNEMSRGTSKREDPLNWVIKLTRDVKPPDAESEDLFLCAHFEKIRGRPEPDTMWQFNFEQGTPGKIHVSNYKTDVFTSFVQMVNFGETFCSEIAKKLAVSKGYVSQLAKRAKDQGLIKIDQKGAYAPVRR